MTPRPRVTREPVKKSAAQWAWLVLVAGCGAGSLPYPVRGEDGGSVAEDGGTPTQDLGTLPQDVQSPPQDSGTGTCPTGMAYIPAGSFMMGDADRASGRAQPPHMVTLSAFCMDLTEATVAAYRGCNAIGCTAPTTNSQFGYNWGVAGRDNHPVNGVDWNQSRAYCQWRGADLPTEAQWEYAARGSDAARHIYPWGNETPASQSCWGGVTNRSSTCPVRSHPSGNSPFGLFDMAGNVWEWTLDWSAPYTGSAEVDPVGPASGTTRVIRGGSWDSQTAVIVRAAYRFISVPMAGYANYGFRCARGAM